MSRPVVLPAARGQPVIVAAVATVRKAQMADPDKQLADPHAEWWTMADIAAYWNVDHRTVRDYRYQTRHPRRPGQAAKLPPHDDTFGPTPVWRPRTIIGFKRPGRGHGGGPKPGGRTRT
jgi:hypothetical protein